MSCRDEQLASEYLKRRPRRRYRGVTAAGFVLLFALVCLWARCAKGELRTIVVDGTFSEGTAGYFGLALPFAARFTVTYDDQAHDEDPSPLLGVYETEGAYVTLRFGPYYSFYFSVPNTEVRIWNGFAGLRGVSFGNEDEFTQYGATVPAYFLYALFAVPASWTPYPADDSLVWLMALQNYPVIRQNAYLFLSGNENAVYLQTHGALTYSVPVFAPRARP